MRPPDRPGVVDGRPRSPLSPGSTPTPEVAPPWYPPRPPTVIVTRRGLRRGYVYVPAPGPNGYPPPYPGPPYPGPPNSYSPQSTIPWGILPPAVRGILDRTLPY